MPQTGCGAVVAFSYRRTFLFLVYSIDPSIRVKEQESHSRTKLSTMSLPEDFSAQVEVMVASGQVDPVSRIPFNYRSWLIRNT